MKPRSRRYIAKKKIESRNSFRTFRTSNVRMSAFAHIQNCQTGVRYFLDENGQVTTKTPTKEYD